ncbi:hypothetical protein ACFW1F_28285 [Streptomyces bungoensis]|uniref:hypothetical protein n=1 Tax=Streptomyces bungoensis TaxID=285568 RepID=UPI00367907EA
MAYPLKTALSRGMARCYGEEPDSYAHVRFTGVSLFHREGEPQLSFMIQTYDDSAAAESVYRSVWKAWKAQVPSARGMEAC